MTVMFCEDCKIGADRVGVETILNLTASQLCNERFEVKARPKLSLCLIKKDTGNTVNQSNLEVMRS